jgi:hypothetical protein
LPVSPPSSAAAKTCKFASQSFLLRPAMEAWGGVCAARAPCLGQGGVSKLLLRQALSAVDKIATALRRLEGIPAQPPVWRPSLSLASEIPSSCHQVARPRWRQDGRCAGLPVGGEDRGLDRVSCFFLRSFV